jgi:hypothetical protein
MARIAGRYPKNKRGVIALTYNLQEEVELLRF